MQAQLKVGEGDWQTGETNSHHLCFGALFYFSFLPSYPRILFFAWVFGMGCACGGVGLKSQLSRKKGKSWF